MKQISSISGVLQFLESLKKDSLGPCILEYAQERVPYVCYGYISNKDNKIVSAHDIGFTPIDVFYNKNKRNNKLMLDFYGALSVCVKAHYFMYKDDVLESNPSVFFIPDLANISNFSIGIYYPLYKNKKAIVVSKRNLLKIANTEIGIFKFPVVLGVNYDNWINVRHWEKLEQDGSIIKDVLMEVAKKDINLIKECKNPANFSYGNIFEVPPALKDKMKEVGLKYASGIKMYYLPSGYDYAPVKEYYDFLIKELNVSSLVLPKK